MEIKREHLAGLKLVQQRMAQCLTPDGYSALGRLIGWASAAPEQEPVAWMDDGSLRSGSASTAHRVVTAEQKCGMHASTANSFSTPLYTHADPSEVERLRALSVTHIMLDVGPGWDGMGEEIYAKSVADVERKLSKMGDQIETLEGARDAATQRADAAERKLAERDARIHEARTMLGEIKEFHWRAECSEHRAALRRHVDLWLSASAEPAVTVTNMGGYDFVEAGKPAKGGDGEAQHHD